MAAVIARHPVLSAIPVDEDKPDTFFVRLPQIDLRRAVKFVTTEHDGQGDEGRKDSELDAVIEGQHNINFKAEYGQLPFWRVIVLHPAGTVSSFALCFVFHHSLADGASGLAFHRSFLSALNTKCELQSVVSKAAGDPNSVNPVVYPPQNPLLPSLEDVLPLPLSVTYVVKTLWNEFIAKAPQNVWTAAPITTSASMQSHFQSFSLSASSTQRLLVTSRTNSTTLTATVETLLAATLFEHLPSDKYLRLMANGAISLRRLMPNDIIDDDSMGTYVSTYKVMHLRPTHGSGQGSDKSTESFSWDEAGRVKAIIEVELNQKGNDSVVGLLRYAGDLTSYLGKKIGKERDQSFEVSNIGVFKPAPVHDGDDLWSVARMVFSQSANVVGPALGTSLVTGGDGRLSVGFSWLDGVVETEWVEMVMRALKSKMEDLAQG